MSLTRLLNSSVGVKKESTSYTYEDPAATDGITIRQDLEVNLNREFLEDDTINGSFSHVPSEPGMWSDDLGGMLPVYLRSGGTAGSIPEFSVLMENAFGSQQDNTDNTVDDTLTDATTTSFKLTTNPADLVVGQLILVDVDGAGTLEPTQVISYSNPTLNVWPPLSTSPADTGAVYAGTNFMLLDESLPYFSTKPQFETDKFIKYKGCLVSTMEVTFEPGQRVPANFTFVAQGLQDYGNATHTDFKSNLDNTTRYLVCLGVDLSATFAGTAKGTPTQTETILSTPSFGVAIGDEILLETSTEWETATVTNVSGNAGEDVTVTHSSVTSAVSADDTVYVRRKKCAGIGDSLSITMEREITPVNCMSPTYGKAAIEVTGRMVTVAKTPFWQDWQEFLTRDNAVGSELMVSLGTETGKIMVWYLPNIQNTEVTITTDALMKNDVTAVANKDTRIGNKNEIVAACF